MARQTIACGDCFRWAGTYITTHDDGTLVHGKIIHPFTKKRPFVHAWIETDGGRVLDWQSMEVGYGGNLVIPGHGYSIDDFYSVFKPRQIIKYTEREAIRNMVSNSHWGPWE